MVVAVPKLCYSVPVIRKPFADKHLGSQERPNPVPLQKGGANWLAPATTLLVMLGMSARALDGAAIYVTFTEERTSGGPGCSLQEAIYSANFHTNIAISRSNADGTDTFVNTNCVPGTGNDTVVLPSRATFVMRYALADAHTYVGPTA